LVNLLSRDVLDYVAVRNPELEWGYEPTGEMNVVIRRRGLLGSRAKKYIFDDIGSYVLRLLDGKRTLREVAYMLASTRGMNIEEAERALVKYVEKLKERGLISLLPHKAVKTCVSCGAEIPSNAFYCPYCGAKQP